MELFNTFIETHIQDGYAFLDKLSAKPNASFVDMEGFEVPKNVHDCSVLGKEIFLIC